MRNHWAAWLGLDVMWAGTSDGEGRTLGLTAKIRLKMIVMTEQLGLANML